MPVFYNVSLDLALEDVLRREGIANEGNCPPQIMNLLEEVLTEVRKENLLRPCFTYQFYRIVSLERERAHLEGAAGIQGTLISSRFAGADEIVIAVCTIGPALEQRSSEYFKNGQETRGLLLDGAGSAAVDVLSRKVCQVLSDQASSRGYQASSPVNPGMPGLPLTEQGVVCRLVQADRIGVRLTSGNMMDPKKSASLVMGVGVDMPKWKPAEVCAQCYLNKNCPYRVHSPDGMKNGND